MSNDFLISTSNRIKKTPFTLRNEEAGVKKYSVYNNTLLPTVFESLKADYFIPFASQVIFYRPDSTWANEYKVTFEDLQLHWNSDAILLHPYTTIDLTDFQISFIETKQY